MTGLFVPLENIRPPSASENSITLDNGEWRGQGQGLALAEASDVQSCKVSQISRHIRVKVWPKGKKKGKRVKKKALMINGG